MQVVLVYLEPFRYNLLLKCVWQPKIVKNTLKTLFLWNSRSFKVISVDKSKKPVTSACYDKQHVCTYLQPFSHYTSQLVFIRLQLVKISCKLLIIWVNYEKNKKRSIFIKHRVEGLVPASVCLHYSLLITEHINR